MIKYSEVQPGMKLYVVTVHNNTYYKLNDPPVIEVTVRSKSAQVREPQPAWANIVHPVIDQTVRLVGTPAYLSATVTDHEPDLVYIPKKGMPGYANRLIADKDEAHKLAAKVLRQKAGTIKRSISSLRANIEVYAASLRDYEKMLGEVEDASKELAKK